MFFGSKISKFKEIVFIFLEIFSDLEKKSKQVHQRLATLNNYTLAGIDISPVKHLRLSFDNTLEKLEKIVDYVKKELIN